METFGLYLFKSAVWLTGFTLVYFLFLRNERFFLLKRVFLISGMLISFIFPLISIHYQVEMPAPDIIPMDIAQAGSPALTGIEQGIPDQSFNYRIILLSLYLSGVLFLAFRFIMHIGSLYKTINRATINNRGNAKLIRASEFPSSFTFLNYVFINPSVDETETDEILNHELVHVRQKHWLDLILVEMLRIVQWVNPFAWIYTGFIRLNHEYLADEVALQRTSNPAIYRAALVNQLFSSPVISLSNSFNYSLNKKRFDMMKKIITSPYRKLKVFLVLPVFAIVFYAFAKPEYHYAANPDNTMHIYQAPSIIAKEVKGVVLKEDGTPFPGVSIVITGTSIGTITDVSGRFTFQNVPDDALLVFSFRAYKTQVLKAEFTSVMNVKMLKDPEYKEEIKVIGYGNDSQISGRINIRNSSDSSNADPLVIIDGVKSNKKGIEGINPNDIVSINVLKDKTATGKYGDEGKDGVIIVTTRRSPERLIVVDDVISSKTRNEVMSEINDQLASFKSLSLQEATEKYGEKGKNGAMEFMTLKRAAELGIKVPFRRRTPDDYPTFQGDVRGSFNSWVVSQVKYPAEATARGIHGNVRVEYTIEADGSVSNVKYSGTPTPDPLLGDVVIRAVQASPKWEPAKNPEAMEPYKSAVSLKFELPDKVVPNIEPFVVVEEMPMYPGGDGELLKFIAENTHYPDSAKAMSIQGRVIVRFVVTTDGNTDDVTVLKGVHPLLDAEAIRVVSMLTGFKPGYQGGKPVPVWYMVPITFTVK